jgi:hypothetical protein
MKPNTPKRNPPALELDHDQAEALTTLVAELPQALWWLEDNGYDTEPLWVALRELDLEDD